MINEDDLIAADDVEKNNTCPLCGGRPTVGRNNPHECCDCWLPVYHWAAVRKLQAELAEARNAAREGK